MKPAFKTVGKVGDIAPGTGKAFEFGDQMVAIFLETDGTYLAIDDLCPHMGASLASGHFSEGIVTCPWHAWSFDARDGAWCDNRRLKIDTFEVRIQNDEIQLAAVESSKPILAIAANPTTIQSPIHNRQSKGLANESCLHSG